MGNITPENTQILPQKLNFVFQSVTRQSLLSQDPNPMVNVKKLQ